VEGPGDGALRLGRVRLLAVLVESQSEASGAMGDTVGAVSGRRLIRCPGVGCGTEVKDTLLMLTLVLILRTPPGPGYFN